MSQPWDLIIVGGGLAGSSLAANACERGLRALLIDAGTPGGQGATAHSRGIVRVYDPSPELLQHNLGGVLEWQRLNCRWPGVFNACGVLYLIASAHLETARAAIAAAHSSRYPMQLVDAERVATLVPQLNPALLDQNSTALWEPFGGYVNPRRATMLFVEQTRRDGGQVIEGSKVDEVIDTGRGAQVRIGDALLHGRMVVIAAGASSSGLVSGSGIFSRSIPLTAFHSPEEQIPSVCLIDEVSGGYLRPQSSQFGFIGGARQNDAPTPDGLDWDPASAKDHHVGLSQHLLRGAPLQPLDGRNGFDGYTAGFLPRIEAPDDESVAIFSGFSGRGAKYIPHAARLFSEQLARRLL